VSSLTKTKYRVLYDNGEGVFWYWGVGGDPVAVDEAVDLSPDSVSVAVGVLMADRMDRVIIEQVGVSWESKPGRVPTFVYDREDAAPVHDEGNHRVAVFSRGGRTDGEEMDGAWVQMARRDFRILQALAAEYPNLVALKPGLCGS
jgi:hypothetical protein